MVREQFKRLSEMHGVLFPVLSTSERSFVSVMPWTRSVLEEGVGEQVPFPTPRLITFVVGEDIEEMPFLLPLPVLLAIGVINGFLLGINFNDVYQKLQQNYSAWDWKTRVVIKSGTDALVTDEGEKRDSVNLGEVVDFLRVLFFEPTGVLQGDEVCGLKEFFEILGKKWNFGSIGAQHLPCRVVE